MAETKQTFFESLTASIDSVFKEECKVIVEKHKLAMNKEIDEKMEEILLRAGFSVSNMVSIGQYGQTIRIELKK